MAIKALKQGVKFCSNLAKYATTIDFRLTSVFFINLEHLSHPTSVLLFILLKVNVGWKCAVKFLSDNTVMLTYTHNHAPGILL